MGIVGLLILIAGIILFAFGFPVEMPGVISLVAGTLICLVALFLKKERVLPSPDLSS